MKIALAATAAVGALAASQIALGQTTTAPAAAPAAPAAAPAAVPTAAPAAGGIPQGDAAIQNFVEDTCTQCHDLTMLSSNPHSPADWADTVQTMRDRGAKVTDEQMPIVVAYLAKTYGLK